MKTLACVIALELLAALAAPSTSSGQADKDTHLFILSGQSNMAGLKEARPNSFLTELDKLLPEAEIVHVKVAKGGQPIRLWVPEWDDIAKKNGLDPIGAEPVFYPQILEACQEAFPDGAAKPKTVTFLWMQGEKDAKTGLDPAYKAALTQLIANLRRDLKAPEMNVVIGRLSDHEPGPEWQAGWDAVRKAQVDLATEDARGAWVDTDDTNDKIKLGQPDNDLHYTPEGYDVFGRRLARQAVALIQGKEPAADGRPE